MVEHDKGGQIKGILILFIYPGNVVSQSMPHALYQI